MNFLNISKIVFLINLKNFVGKLLSNVCIIGYEELYFRLLFILLSHIDSYMALKFLSIFGRMLLAHT